ncbi:MAG TPA: DUF3488 and transglutaminase-like domain-containing protein [Actinomycetota bacterium]
MATALAFGRVFLGRAPTWELVAAALASVLVATALERRGLFLALLASAVGLGFLLTWIVLPQTSWYGLPSLRTLRAVGRCLEVVGQQARVQAAPTPPFPPLMLASVTAIWTASFSIHALVVRAGSPLLAVLPSVALVGFADAVMEDGTRPAYAVIVLGAALSVVFVDGLRRIRLWGPIWTTLKSRRLSRVTSRGARRVAFLAIAVAILVPGLLPGFRSDALVDFSTSGEGGIRLDPFVSIQAQLEDRAAVDLFSVDSETGSYWRLYALDRFDGLTWSSSDPEATQGLTFATPARLPTDFPADSEPLDQRYRILTDIDDPWIPMAYPPESITLPLGEVRYDSELGTAVVDGGLEEGLEYSVTSRLVSPDPKALDAVRLLPPGRYGRYTFIPANVDPRIGEIAREWVAGESTPYRQVLALQHRFREAPFRYELDVEPVADADAVLTFLTETQQGFCQQFATTMALMVRELGYPSRVAVGYRSGRDDGGSFTVRTSDAHAWVEVLFPGYGWLAFEPTPGRALPTAAEEGTYQNPGTALDEVAGGAGQAGSEANVREGSGGTCTDAAGRPLPSQLCNADPLVGNRPVRDVGPLPAGLGAQPAPADEGGYSVPYAKILLALLVAAAILLVLIPIVKGAWRGLLIRRSHRPRELVLTAYRVFDGEAADLGVGRRAGETLDEHRARLAAAVAFSDGHLDRLTRTASRAAYGAAEPTAEEARLAVSDARIAIRDLRKDAGWLRRVAGTYRPGL